MTTGRIFNVQRFSLHDGPGLRSTVFLKGCPLACGWCHNPESQAFGAEVIVLENRCAACGACTPACPQDGPVWPARGRDAAAAGCTLCGACVEACPTRAREFCGSEWTVAELLAELRKDRSFYEASRGGVTFGGGEPLAQPAFLIDALEACQAEGLHTALDTCGQCSLDDLQAAARRSDLVLYDLKHLDPDRHREATGVDNVRILANLQALAAWHPALWIRIPLVPGFNDAPRDLEAMAGFAAGLPGDRPVHLLPFHATGAGKSSRIGRSWAMAGIGVPGPAELDRARRCFEDQGLRTLIGG
jgi:pyruvate formate lyase activating enzyme